ncbi:hypothetical protein AAEX37_00328 [Oligella sp. MSHR50489EDL]|uniref:copper resistance protein NlpE n=1 Tax=Oligella sp. MSHR50489EDL TaxID=3139409 RepID=UPI003D8141CC
MKKLAFILSTSVALVSTAYAQTAADVAATDSLNSGAEIRMTESVVTATQVAKDEARVDESVTVTEMAPNQEAKKDTMGDRKQSLGGVEGHWTGTVPCASCPGVDVDLKLNADGTFTMNEKYQETADGNFTATGMVEYAPKTGVVTLKTADDQTRHMLLKDGQLFYIDAEGNARSDYMLKRAK